MLLYGDVVPAEQEEAAAEEAEEEDEEEDEERLSPAELKVSSHLRPNWPHRLSVECPENSSSLHLHLLAPAPPLPRPAARRAVRGAGRRRLEHRAGHSLGCALGCVRCLLCLLCVRCVRCGAHCFVLYPRIY